MHELSIARSIVELVEEQADNYLDEDNFPDSKMTDANVKKRIKHSIRELMPKRLPYCKSTSNLKAIYHSIRN